MRRLISWVAPKKNSARLKAKLLATVKNAYAR